MDFGLANGPALGIGGTFRVVARCHPIVSVAAARTLTSATRTDMALAIEAQSPCHASAIGGRSGGSATPGCAAAPLDFQPGKPKKLPLTACMRKPLIILNAMARTQIAWRPPLNPELA